MEEAGYSVTSFPDCHSVPVDLFGFRHGDERVTASCERIDFVAFAWTYYVMAQRNSTSGSTRQYHLYGLRAGWLKNILFWSADGIFKEGLLTLN